MEKLMLRPEELSIRIGVCVGTLQNWRVRRKAGEEIGPPFVKLGAGSNARARYLISEVEAWEAGLSTCGECTKGPARAQTKARTRSRPAGEVVRPSNAEKPLLTPQQLSERTGVRLDYLSNWRVRRNAGEEIGPAFVKLGRHVRYRLADVEAWEGTPRAAREMAHPAASALQWHYF